MSCSKFPLRKLPFVVLRETFSHMDKQELFNFSFCSKLAQKILKLCCFARFEMCVHLGCEPNITLHYGKEFVNGVNCRLKNAFSCHDEHKQVPVREQKNLSFPLDNSDPDSDPVSRTLKFIDHFLTTFRCTIDELILKPNCIQTRFQDLIKSIISRQKIFPNLSVHKHIDLEDLKFLNENLQVTDWISFNVSVTLPENFKFSWNTDDWEITHGESFSIENFLNLNFMTCEIFDANFTCDDWRTIVLAWMAGWNPNMKHLMAEGNYDYIMILRKLGPYIGKLKPESLVRMMFYKNNMDSYGAYFNGGYDFQRESDGKLATLFVHEGVDRVQIHVWD